MRGKREERERKEEAEKNGEKGRERGTPCPTSNKLVIIFSQYLSWIGCYFIIFYCLLLLLLPVQKPPSASRLPLPPFTPLANPLAAAVAVSLTPSTATTADAPRSVLLSRASLPPSLFLFLFCAFSLFVSLHVEGIHSRNSLLKGLFCCNRCCPPPVPAYIFYFFCTASPFFPSFRRSFLLQLLLSLVERVVRETHADH